MMTKTPPYDINSEMAIIGSILLDKNILDDINLKPNDFYHIKHQHVYTKILNAYKNAGIIDLVTMSDDEVDITYLNECTDRGILTGNFKAYSDKVKDMSLLRKQIHIATDVLEKAYNGENALSVLKTIDDIEDCEDDIFSIQDVSQETVQRMHEYENSKGFEGIKTGIRLLDFTLSGLRKTNFILLAARPGMGKTAFALQVGKGAAKNGENVAIFSLEMGRHELVKRMLVNESRVHLNLIKERKASSESWGKIHDAANELYKQNIFISDKSMQTVDEILKKCKRIKKKHGLDLVIIDYIQLMKDAKKFNSSNEKVGYDSRMLKLIAKELDIPVLCLSQLSRAVETRSSKIPILSDLRDSGSLEQDADSIIFLYREDYYKKDEKDFTPTHETDVIIAKNRHGELKNFKMHWNGGTQRFDNI